MEKLELDGLQAAKAALLAYLKTQTVFGVNVGTHATDAELTAAATDTIQAYLDFVNSPKF